MNKVIGQVEVPQKERCFRRVTRRRLRVDGKHAVRLPQYVLVDTLYHQGSFPRSSS